MPTSLFAPTRVLYLRSRYPGLCHVCDQSYAAGSRIVITDEIKIVHQSCWNALRELNR